MEPRIAVVSLWAEDVINTAHFYHDVLGLKLSAHHGGMPHFDVNGVVLVILKGRPSPAEESHPPDFPILAFEVENLDLMIDRLQKHGVDLPWGMEQRTGSRWIKFYDPGGNLIELVSYEP
jgi:predicted enzyme related to lactoylglutathione lyase